MPTAHTSEPDWNAVLWRNLQKGEAVRPGDWVEFEKGHAFHGSTEWRPAQGGNTASDPAMISHVRYRRIIPSKAHVASARTGRHRTELNIQPLLDLLLDGAFSGQVMEGTCKMIKARFRGPQTIEFTYVAPVNWRQEHYEWTDARVAGAIALWDMLNVP